MKRSARVGQERLRRVSTRRNFDLMCLDGMCSRSSLMTRLHARLFLSNSRSDSSSPHRIHQPAAAVTVCSATVVVHPGSVVVTVTYNVVASGLIGTIVIPSGPAVVVRLDKVTLGAYCEGCVRIGGEPPAGGLRGGDGAELLGSGVRVSEDEELALVVACLGGEYEYVGCEPALLLCCCSTDDGNLLVDAPTELCSGIG